MAKLFFFLSGEHENLPFSEVKAILEAEGYAYEITEKLDQILRLEADPACVEAVKRRAAFTRICCLELFSCRAEMTSIIRTLRSTDLGKILGDGMSFVVRVKHVREYSSNLDGMILEQKLGEIVIGKKVHAKVKFRNPDITFLGILTSRKFIFGSKLMENPAKPFVERGPRKKPFFHPSAMTAKLARCMVNLAKPGPGEIVLDPFCGTGTMLIEATLIGCRTLGMDIQRRMVKGTLRNLAHFDIRPEGIMVGDAKNLPFTGIDCVVTDPPYGISSTTVKRTTTQLVVQVLAAVRDVMARGRRVCIAAPKKLNIGLLGKELGYRHLESHFVYVHRSLTREIVVFEKM